jgi:hypothetical protein
MLEEMGACALTIKLSKNVAALPISFFASSQPGLTPKRMQTQSIMSTTISGGFL